jgi:hypothetical protein
MAILRARLLSEDLSRNLRGTAMWKSPSRRRVVLNQGFCCAQTCMAGSNERSEAGTGRGSQSARQVENCIEPEDGQMGWGRSGSVVGQVARVVVQARGCLRFGAGRVAPRMR